MNKVVLLGYISQDPKAKEYPEKNLTTAKFSIATTDMRNYKQTFFFNCIAWNQTAEYVNNNLKKGDFVLIDGRLTNRSYINEQGLKVYITEVVVDTIKNLGTHKSKSTDDVVDVDAMIENKQKNNNATIDLAPLDDEPTSESTEVDWDDL